MRALGYDVLLLRAVAFGLGAFVAACAGVISVWWNTRISPGSINLGQTIDMLVIAVIGGLFRLEGAWVGAIAFVAARQLDPGPGVGRLALQHRHRRDLPRHRAAVARRLDGHLGVRHRPAPAAARPRARDPLPPSNHLSPDPRTEGGTTRPHDPNVTPGPAPGNRQAPKGGTMRDREEGRHRRLYILLAALVLVLSAIAAGCGGGDDEEAGDTQAATNTGGTATSGTIKIGIFGNNEGPFAPFEGQVWGGSMLPLIAPRRDGEERRSEAKASTARRSPASRSRSSTAAPTPRLTRRSRRPGGSSSRRTSTSSSARSRAARGSRWPTTPRSSRTSRS